MIKEDALELLKTAPRTDKPCRINHGLTEAQAVGIVEACVMKVADGGVLYDILEKRVRQMLVPINSKDAEIVNLSACLKKALEIVTDFENGFDNDVFGVLPNGNAAQGYDEGIVRGGEYLNSIKQKKSALDEVINGRH